MHGGYEVSLGNLIRRGARYEASIIDAASGLLHRGTRAFRIAAGVRGFLKASPTLQIGMITSLAPFEQPVFNQGATASCNGHRSAGAVYTAFAASGAPLSFIPSPDAWYRNARCLERSSLSVPLTDSGSATSDILTAGSTCGLLPIQSDKSLSPSAFTDVSQESGILNREPRLDELETEATTVITGEYAIDVTDTNAAIAQIQAALLAKYPVWIDAVVDSLFEDWGNGWSTSTPPLDDVSPPGDPQAGGHALYITEMVVTSSGVVTISGLNSWGEWGAPSFANGPNTTGHFRVGANWLQKAVYSITVGKVARL